MESASSNQTGNHYNDASSSASAVEKLNVKKLKIKDYKVGGKDDSDNLIKHIYWKSDEFIIYEIDTSDPIELIRVDIDTEDPKETTLRKRLSGIIGSYSRFRRNFYKAEDKFSYKVRVAHLIAMALQDEVEQANQEIEKVTEDINAAYKTQLNHRIRYLGTIGAMCLALIITAVYVYTEEHTDMNLTIRNLIYAVAGGSIGCFISISARLKSFQIERDVHEFLYIVYGLERIFVAGLAGAIIYFAIKCNILFGFVNELTNPLYGIVIFSIVAGFSETLVPNLLTRLENENVSPK